MLESMSSLLFLSIFIFAIFLLPGSVSPLSCFTDYCPSDNSTLCLTICPPSHNYCFRNTTFPPSIRIPGARLGCSEVDCNIPCDYEEYEDTDGEGEYCCCSGDYCNDDSKLGNLMKPKFEYRIPPLDEWPPLSYDGMLVCEYYNCDDGACIRGYKVCENCSVGNGTCGCSTIYSLNSTNNKLYLHSKDCISDLQAAIWATPQCVINTTFNGSLASLYICYCNVSLCNMNETVLYPTRLMSYGLKECEDHGCDFSCSVIDNMLRCNCPPGMNLSLALNCFDVNECMINNGGCEQLCVNTRGSYYCDCHDGFIMDNVTNKCLESSDAFYCTAYYKDDVLVTNISSSAIQRQTCLSKSCFAQYIYVNGLWYLHILTCGYPEHPLDSVKMLFSCSQSQCNLEKFQDFVNTNIYTCCCNGLNCNNVSQIHFPATSVASVLTTPTLVPTDVSEDSDATLVIILWTIIGAIFLVIIFIASCLLIWIAIMMRRIKKIRGLIAVTLLSVKKIDH